jgi:hypothetical protein
LTIGNCSSVRAHLAGVGLDREGIEHLVRDEVRTLVPTLVPGQLAQLLAYLLSAVGSEDGAV